VVHIAYPLINVASCLRAGFLVLLFSVKLVFLRIFLERGFRRLWCAGCYIEDLSEKKLSKVSLPSNLALHHALLLQAIEHFQD